jgi:hypothetical protein
MYCYVDTWQKAIDACHQLRRRCEGIFAFDLEGVNLGREGVVTLLQIAVDENQVFCFDVLLLGRALFAPECLGGLFMEPNVVKVCFDCRVDGDVLQSHFGLRLSTMYDIQVLYTLVFQSKGDRFLKGLLHVLQMPEVVTHKGVLRRVLSGKRRMKALMRRQQVFLHRPLSKETLEYCTSDVVYLLRMHRLWGGRVHPQRIISTSMDRLHRFWGRTCEIPPQQMSLVDFH